MWRGKIFSMANFLAYLSLRVYIEIGSGYNACMKKILNSPIETEEFGWEFAQTLKTRQDTATIVALEGNLGSGKTTFVQAVAKALGVKEHLTSPTFVIMKPYELHNHTFKRLIHVDAYRLKHGEELTRLAWPRYANDPGNIIFIEWPEHVADILPADAKKIALTFIDEHTRGIEL